MKMAKGKKPEKGPVSKMAFLMAYVEQLEVFLHPRVIQGFKQAVWDARTEMAQEAKGQVFSREMQELQPLLEDYRKSIQIYSESRSARHLWHMRPLLKKILELYGKPAENIP